MGTQWLLGDKLAFLNISEEMLHNELLELLLPPAKTVLELETGITPSPAVLERCQFLRRRGYRIAFKDRGISLVGSPFIDHADYAKIDMQAYTLDEVARRFLEYQILDIIVVAEKVEERAQYDACKAIGFHLIQGFYFARTQTFTAKVINPAFAAVLDLLSADRRDADIRDIENGFKRDAALSFKLLRYAPSVSAYPAKSSRCAMPFTIIGTKQLYRWLTLLMITAGESEGIASADENLHHPWPA